MGVLFGNLFSRGLEGVGGVSVGSCSRGLLCGRSVQELGLDDVPQRDRWGSLTVVWRLFQLSLKLGMVEELFERDVEKLVNLFGLDFEVVESVGIVGDDAGEDCGRTRDWFEFRHGGAAGVVG